MSGLDELTEEFVAEIRDLLDAVEPDFLAMEKSGGDIPPDLINRAFRAMHSIKGSAGFGGFEALKRLSHALENVLVKIRDGHMALDPAKMDVMLASMDKIRIMVNNIYECQNVPHQEEIERLNQILDTQTHPISLENRGEQGGRVKVVSGQNQHSATESDRVYLTANDTDFEISRDKLKSALSDAMYIYALEAYADTDLKQKNRTKDALIQTIEETGRCLAIKVDIGNENIYRLLFATILEPEFICQLFDIPEKQIFRFNRDTLIEITEVETPSTTELQTPSTAKVETPSTTELQTPSTAKVETPSTTEVQTPSTTEVETPSTTEVETPSITEVQTPSSLVPTLQRGNEGVRVMPHNVGNISTDPPKRVGIGEGELRADNETIRVNVGLIDKLMNLVGEMVLSRNQLHQTIRDYLNENPQIHPLMQNLNVVISEVQEHIMQMRMQPVANVLNKLPRVIRDISRQLSKEIDFVIQGGKVELDKSILEGLSNPLTHLLRNCVDHGIEVPEERIKAGKHRRGQIELKVFHGGGHVNIIIRDDGAGIDPERVAQKAVSKGLVEYSQVRRMSDTEKLNLIFLPGLSTAESVTEISGRGVGMDVVKTNINNLGGHLDVTSTKGEGTSVHIVIPLTLAIIPCLIVGAGKYRFAIPQINVQELVCVKASEAVRRIEKIGESEVLRLRERLLPLVSLSGILDIEQIFIHPETGEEMIDRRQKLADERKGIVKKINKSETIDSPSLFQNSPPPLVPTLQRGNEGESINKNETIDSLFQRVKRDLDEIPEWQEKYLNRRKMQSDIYIVVLKIGSNTFGLHVNELFDNEEIVVKPMSEHIKECKCFAGATIMGDGRVAMILDAAGIASYTRLHFGEVENEEQRRMTADFQKTISIDRERRSIIVFNNAADEYFALPLSDISRLEITSSSIIERVGNQEFLTYQEKALPLIRLERLLPVHPVPENLGEVYVIIPKTKRSPAGIIVSRILDTVDTDISILKDTTTKKGFSGSAIVNGHLTFFLNIDELLDIFDQNL